MSDEQWIDEILMMEASYIEDDGFTDRLMTRLPRQRKQVRLWMESLILLFATIAALACAIWVVPGFDQFVKATMQKLLENSFVANSGVFLLSVAALTGLSCLIGNVEV